MAFITLNQVAPIQANAGLQQNVTVNESASVGSLAGQSALPSPSNSSIAPASTSDNILIILTVIGTVIAALQFLED